MSNSFYNFFSIPSSLHLAYEMLRKFYRLDYLLKIDKSLKNG